MKTQDKRIKIGTRFVKGGARNELRSKGEPRRVRTVVDIYSTYNHAGELVRITYVSEHDFLKQKIKVEDVPAATIIRGLIEEKLT